jgi:hypothetical protein
MGDLAMATKELTEAIKLNPALREPRDELEAIRKRTKANPRLEQALQDMSLVEERGLRALNCADLKRARQQLELLLKDARAHGEAHWECRALLALALLCQDEGECDAAQDYIDAAQRKMSAADDRRAELYCLQASTHTQHALAHERLRARPHLPYRTTNTTTTTTSSSNHHHKSTQPLCCRMHAARLCPLQRSTASGARADPAWLARAWRRRRALSCTLTTGTQMRRPRCSKAAWPLPRRCVKTPSSRASLPTCVAAPSTPTPRRHYATPSPHRAASTTRVAPVLYPPARTPPATTC